MGKLSFDLLWVTDTFDQCVTLKELEQSVLKYTAGFGVTHVLSGVMPPFAASVTDQLNCVLFGSWPTEWAERYFKLGYLDLDPTIQHVREKSSRLNWDHLVASDDFVMKEAEAFKLKAGVTIPMSTIDGVRIGMSFAGETLDDSPECETAFIGISAAATKRALDLIKARDAAERENINLTAAEMRCLHWLLEGKTNREIAGALGISAKTVEKHISAALRKTGATNRCQLIAQALRIGLLH